MDIAAHDLASEKVLLCHRRDGAQVVDLTTGAVERKYREGSNTLQGIKPAGESSRHLASAQADKALIYFWDRDSEAPTYKASLPEQMTAIVFDSPCFFLMAGSTTGRIYLWMLESGSLIRTWTAHCGAITALMLVGDDNVLVTAGGDGVIKAHWMSSVVGGVEITVNVDDVPSYRCWSGHTQGITTITGELFEAGLSQVFSGSLDNTLRVWTWESDRCVGSFRCPSRINFLLLDPLHLLVHICCGDSNIYLMPADAAMRQNFHPDFEDITRFPHLRGHVDGVRCAAVTSDGKLVSCASDGVKVWNVRNRIILYNWPHFGDSIVGIHTVTYALESASAPLKFGTFSGRPESLLEARKHLTVSDDLTSGRQIFSSAASNRLRQQDAPPPFASSRVNILKEFSVTGRDMLFSSLKDEI